MTVINDGQIILDIVEPQGQEQEQLSDEMKQAIEQYIVDFLTEGESNG